MPTSSKARAKHRIAALEQDLETMQQERGSKQRKTTYYIAQGRAVCCLVILYNNLEDLISENDHRYEVHTSGAEVELPTKEYVLKKGANAACGNDTSSLKELIATWINQDFCPSILIKPHDKHLHSFASDSCGKFSALANGTGTQTVNHENLEEGFVKSKLLVLAFKVIFTSPSSVKEADGDGDGADILENNRRTHRRSDQTKVKTCITSIINMKKVTPCAITYVVCQVCFALSSVSSWYTMDGDFDHKAFWNNIVDFFKDIPGPVAKHRMDKLLEWWTRKIFGTNHREDLMPDVVSQMSVNALAIQRKVREDAAFDLD
ncbi:hypothetical protein F4604DRAFT_1676683 [Suillus subluteus]|nr:hypothetical protein F4604DRAFT_1676683 [Suillus subluteus]